MATNATWELGDIYHLPYADGAFPLVVTRYSFHHLTDPAALQEMARVCRPDGRVCVIDMVVSRACAEAFNTVERYLATPSHTRALPPEDLVGLFPAAGLAEVGTATYQIEWEVEGTPCLRPRARRRRPVPRRPCADVGRRVRPAHLAGDELRYAYTNLAVVGWKGGQIGYKGIQALACSLVAILTG